MMGMKKQAMKRGGKPVAMKRGGKAKKQVKKKNKKSFFSSSLRVRVEMSPPLRSTSTTRRRKK